MTTSRESDYVRLSSRQYPYPEAATTKPPMQPIENVRKRYRVESDFESSASLSMQERYTYMYRVAAVDAHAQDQGTKDAC